MSVIRALHVPPRGSQRSLPWKLQVDVAERLCSNVSICSAPLPSVTELWLLWTLVL